MIITLAVRWYYACCTLRRVVKISPAADIWFNQSIEQLALHFHMLDSCVMYCLHAEQPPETTYASQITLLITYVLFIQQTRHSLLGQRPAATAAPFNHQEATPSMPSALRSAAAHLI
jgi:hypothetical protein